MEYYIDEKKENNPSDARCEAYGVSRKTKLFEAFVISLTKPKLFCGLATQKPKKTKWYKFFVAFIVVLMIYIVPTAAQISQFGGFTSLFRDKMPAFEIQNGELVAEKAFETKIADLHILIDASYKGFNKAMFDSDGVYLAFNKRGGTFALVSSSGVDKIWELDYKDNIPDGTNNQSFVDMVPLFYSFFLVFALLTLLFVMFKYMLLAWIYSFLMRGIWKYIHADLDEKDQYHLCFYAQTPGILLVNLNVALGGFIPGFLASIIGIFITFVLIRKSVEPYLEVPEDPNKQ